MLRVHVNYALIDGNDRSARWSVHIGAVRCEEYDCTYIKRKIFQKINPLANSEAIICLFCYYNMLSLYSIFKMEFPFEVTNISMPTCLIFQ